MTFNQKLIVLAIAIIGGLEALALYKGIDGKSLGIAIGAIGGLAGGYKLRDLFPGKPTPPNRSDSA